MLAVVGRQDAGDAVPVAHAVRRLDVAARVSATIVDDARPSTVESTASGCVVSGSKAQPGDGERGGSRGARPTDSNVPIGFRLRVIRRQAGVELCVPYKALTPIAQIVCLPETRCNAVAKACPLCVFARRSRAA